VTPHGVMLWPRLGGGFMPVSQGTYTCSLGTSAGVASLTCHVGAAPAPFGDLIIRDGLGEVVVRGCKLDKARVSIAQSGNLNLTILDRRHRWVFGGINGRYNTLTPRGDPVPWNARTVFQLMELCLAAMGERRYSVIVPEGFRNNPAAFDPANPAPGAYPPVDWWQTPPAQALEALAMSIGCVVAYRPHDDSVLIAPQGEGAFLPTDGSIASESPTLDPPERPDKIVLTGTPTRFQARFVLEAMGLEWTTEYKLLKDLSYKPAGANQSQTVRLVPIADQVGNLYSVTLTDADGAVTWEFVATVATEAAIAQGLADAVEEAPREGYSAVASGDTLTITGPAGGKAFSVETTADENGAGGDPSLAWELVSPAYDESNPFALSGYPTFGGVIATEQRTRLQNVELARSSVYRAYRITLRDPADPTNSAGKLKIPEYDGPLERIQQIVLLPDRAEQITPQPADEGLLDDQGRPRKVLLYDSWNRDKPARVIATDGYFIGQIGNHNARAGSDVTLDFSIDAERGLVLFSAPVFYQASGVTRPPQLVLETCCTLLDATTNTPIAEPFVHEFGPPLSGTSPLFVSRDDVKVDVLGVYEDETDHRLVGSVTNLTEARKRAEYYLRATARTYELTGQQERTFNGIAVIALDGAISQVTWSVGSSGCTTQASRNSEHSRVIPPLPVRVRNGLLEMQRPERRGAQPGGQVPAMLDGLPGTEGYYK
jgi:hypothetical protein